MLSFKYYIIDVLPGNKFLKSTKIQIGSKDQDEQWFSLFHIGYYTALIITISGGALHYGIVT